MFINISSIASSNTIAATNDADAVTGNQSVKWGGLNPNVATGATGNVAALSGLSVENGYIFDEDQRGLPKLIQLKMDGAFQAGQPNYFTFKISNLLIDTPKKVLGIVPVGIFDEASTETGATPTPSLIQVPEAIVFTVIKDRITVKVPAANITLVDSKIINVMVWFTV